MLTERQKSEFDRKIEAAVDGIRLSARGLIEAVKCGADDSVLRAEYVNLLVGSAKYEIVFTPLCLDPAIGKQLHADYVELQAALSEAIEKITGIHRLDELMQLSSMKTYIDDCVERQTNQR